MKKDNITEALLDVYGGPVPRYTSYPPATQFKILDDAALLQERLSKLGGDQPVSLYFHIPFCRQLCSYCGCMTRVVHDDGPIHDYVRLLEKEIKLVSACLPNRLAVSHVHFGGGSPNLLAKDDLLRLFAAIETGFSIRDDAEIAMEADPRQMSREKAQLYAEFGFNRISLGVQDFQLETQRAINRIQEFSLIENCVRWLREAGIGSINFDLIYGLPYQTVESIADNIKKTAELGPDRVALFGYAHVPWMKPHQKILEKYHLPDSLQRFTQAEKAREALLKTGYRAIGMDHFAKQGDTILQSYEGGMLKRNFQGYTNDNAESLIGFGLSAISRFPDGYYQNSSKSGAYEKHIENGHLPVEKRMPLSKEDALRADIIETLMCYFQVSCDDICRKHGFPSTLLQTSFDRLAAMEKDGLVHIEGLSIQITPLGKPFLRRICACFDAYYQMEENRHACAV